MVENTIPPPRSPICAIPEWIVATAIPGPCSSSCTHCCKESANYPFCSLLSPGVSQSVLFSESGAFIILEYTLSLNGITVEGLNASDEQEPVLICVTIEYEGSTRSRSIRSGDFHASWQAATEWGSLPAGASVSLTPITGGGFSLVYNPPS